MANPSGGLGGAQLHRFTYDSLYRLTEATGTFTDAKRSGHNYTLKMGYDRIHNITSKEQIYKIAASSGSTTTNSRGTYSHGYTYSTNRPHAPARIGARSYSYDANGNQASFTQTGAYPRRTLQWDEENRLMSVVDRSTPRASTQTDFVYDAAGERVLKIEPVRGTDVAYVNQHYQVQDRGTPTKHVFVGTTRVATKIVPTRFRGTRVCTRPKESAEGDNLYFYHPDHLGTTGFITDCQGKLYRHTTYFPFGETWVDQGREAGPSSYLFTGKELDDETGLYYYGARYYDPRTSVWQSTDPVIVEETGRLVAASRFVGAYTYAFNHPVNLIDPDGRAPEHAFRAGSR